MKIYTTKFSTTSKKCVVVDDMFLTKDSATTAGSKMLDGYESLFESEVITRLSSKDYSLAGKVAVGEFAIDLVGETSFCGSCEENGKLLNACVEAVKDKEILAGLSFDVNGAIRRATAQSDLICVKPTYGTVSRYGMIPVACSGETVSVVAKTVSECKEIFDTIVGHDDKDGTSLLEEQCENSKQNTPSLKKVAVLKSMLTSIDKDVKTKIDDLTALLAKNNIEICEIDDEFIKQSKTAWNALMCAELCNNVSRYDGVKYGYRSNTFSNIDELYTNSRSESFGELLKAAILYGSQVLSSDHYMPVYDKSLRIRRLVAEEFAKIFKDYDAVILPACSSLTYTKEQVSKNKFISFEENLYTAPASITGLPAIVVGGVQIIGNHFTENTLFEIAKMYEKEGK